MNKKNTDKTILFSIIVLLMLVIVAEKSNKVSPQKNIEQGILTSLKSIDKDLQKEIQEYSKEHKIEPIDAKIDGVWKAIPGYNGKSVDIGASYKKMAKDKKFSEEKIVYKEIPPEVHLDDLEPQPIYRGNPEKPMVAPMVNVAWGNEYIPKILEVLEKHEVKLTFFFDGSWVKKNPELAKEIKDSGHEIGNHAYSHPDLSKYSREQTTQELQKTNDVIEETLGIKVKWFAPPSGSFNENTVKVAKELGMKTVLWTVDTVDWRKPETNEMVNRVVNGVENGTLILMHPTKPTSEGLDMMLTNIKQKGYVIGTVSELMNESRIGD